MVCILYFSYNTLSLPPGPLNRHCCMSPPSHCLPVPLSRHCCMSPPSHCLPVPLSRHCCMSPSHWLRRSCPPPDYATGRKTTWKHNFNFRNKSDANMQIYLNSWLISVAVSSYICLFLLQFLPIYIIFIAFSSYIYYFYCSFFLYLFILYTNNIKLVSIYWTIWINIDIYIQKLNTY